ncbi:carbohydrate ABC transporter permease [Spirochaeta cellobiosiphila]|uniref:carbohydrate ABC transporter permease n=1 Tax=Spirochaeta cellobiosiphila TaxID=504483 RepID=UPI0004028CE2|nr:sugar ABC transporter permease [Spirochaeta cellobiosiphila]
MTIKQKKELRSNLVGYSFLLPNFIGFLIFTFFPIIFSLLLGFTSWDGVNEIKFVGLNNFIHMAKDETFRISTFNTVYYTLGTVPLTLVCSLGLAVLLNSKIRGRNIFRTIFFFPYVASLVAVAVVWNMIFHPTMGPINSILSKIGIENLPGWTASTKWAMPTVILASIWKGMGYYMIIYLAALQGIPKYLYEVAELDGASKWKQFWHITRPMLTPATFFVSMMLTISCFKVFDLIFVMTNGGPGRATNVLVYHIYNQAFIHFKYGYSSAIALVLFAIVLIVTLIQFRMEKKWVSYM